MYFIISYTLSNIASISVLRVSLGDHNWHDPTRPDKYVTLSKITLHPKNWDVAIFTLSEEIQFNKKIAPICLPAKTDKDYAGDMGIVTGWGISVDGYSHNSARYQNVRQPRRLLDAEVKIVSNEACQRVAEEHDDKVYDDEMCSLEHGSTCQGDSGGPLFLEEYNDR